MAHSRQQEQEHHVIIATKNTEIADLSRHLSLCHTEFQELCVVNEVLDREKHEIQCQLHAAQDTVFIKTRAAM